MHALQQMFPSLTLFSDLDWDAVTQEYESEYMDISFPEYLQQKALEGDCPPYLFELAFYELALFDAKTSMEPFPFKTGIYLNPTALFLSLEFDVKKMLSDAKSGKIEIYERNHVLCIYRDRSDKVHTVEMSEEELELLQHLEDGMQMNKSFVGPNQQNLYKKLIRDELILDLFSA
jgi:hypothetical protein